ncbi:MAG: flagellar biosynthetic protein FliO [Proteobacteria bacterium]|nr:flagellar biosynthetic protein FliO [Pseudomonadota bacterium]
MGFDTYLRFIMMLVLVIGMIAFIAWLVRRFGFLNRIAPGMGVKNASRRLAVIESCTVDAKRRLVLVRRDQAEHLILLTGTGSAVVIERGTEGNRQRKKERGTTATKFAAALAQEEQEWDDEAEAAEDEPVTRLTRFGKSASR